MGISAVSSNELASCDYLLKGSVIEIPKMWKSGAEFRAVPFWYMFDSLISLSRFGVEWPFTTKSLAGARESHAAEAQKALKEQPEVRADEERRANGGHSGTEKDRAAQG